MVETVQGKKLLIGRRPAINWMRGGRGEGERRGGRGDWERKGEGSGE